MTHPHRLLLAIGLITAALLTAPAHAQVTQAVWAPAWPDTGLLAQTIDEPIWIGGGEDERGSGDVDILYWASEGRVKTSREDAKPRLVFGYDILILSVDADSPAITDGYSDIAVVMGYDLGEWQGFHWRILGGGGVAVDNHFSNSDGYYGIGDISASTDFHNGLIAFGLRYNGNSLIFPDIPLPYVQYVETVSPEFTFFLGFPATGLIWTPSEQWIITLDITGFTSLNARATWVLSEQVQLFAAFEMSKDAFAIHDMDNRRMFYEMNRVYFGARFIPTDWLDISVGFGYAFNQEFSSGWDIRDTDTVIEPSDEPLIYFAIRGTF